MSDPILKFISDPTVGLIINKSMKISNRIRAQWSDGFDLNQLPILKQNNCILLTNNIILDSVKYQDYIHTVDTSYYGMMYCDYNVNEDILVQRQFNCFSNRFDIFRQSWFYHLVRKNWLDQGYVSFNVSTARNSVPSDDYFGLTKQEIFEKSFVENNQVFLNEHKKIKNDIPYKNFQDNGDLTNFVLQSKFSIVLETWFHDNRVITFSEKIMRCLQLPRPWLLFSTKHAVKYLNEWGFDVLEDIVDHSYDKIDDQIQRQLKILEIAEKMFTLDISKIEKRCKEASLHNQSLMKTWKSRWANTMNNEFAVVQNKLNLLPSR